MCSLQYTKEVEGEARARCFVWARNTNPRTRRGLSVWCLDFLLTSAAQGAKADKTETKEGERSGFGDLSVKHGDIQPEAGKA